MAIDYSAIAAAGGFGKGKPRKLVKATKRADASTALKNAYAEVDGRDKRRSWVSGRSLTPGVANDRARLEHHHLDRRSQSKSRIADPFNVISVSAFEADLLDAHALIPVDKFGDEVHDTRLIHHFSWNPRMVKPGKAPIRLPALACRPAVA